MTFQQAKTTVLSTLALVMLVTMAGCSTMTVTYDYDDHFPWRSFKTYAWLRSTQPAPTNQASAQMSGDLLDKRIRQAVGFEFSERGITEDTASPELLVKYHLGAEDKLQVTDWGYRYSDYYWGYGGRQIDVYEYTQGTLVIDIIDAETKTLIWRGNATGTVEGGQRSPEEMQIRVNSVVQETMESFPPK